MGCRSWRVAEGPAKTMTTTLESLERRVAALESALIRSSPSTTNTIVLDKELDRILARMETIRGTYASHQSWSKDDKVEFAKLKARKSDIKKTLGITY